MKCPECKRDLPNEAISCPICGYRFSNISNDKDDRDDKRKKIKPPHQVNPALIVTLAMFAAAFLIEMIVYLNI